MSPGRGTDADGDGVGDGVGDREASWPTISSVANHNSLKC